MIGRPRHLAAIRALLRAFPVVAILGPRQSGKSTLAREIAEEYGGSTVFDLEDPATAQAFVEPGLMLRARRGLVVLDEIQHAPALFPLLRVLADRPGAPARFLVLGSASPELLRQGSESLAGRIAWYELDGFALDEVADSGLLHVRGGLPPSVLAADDAAAAQWRDHYVRSLLARDLPQLGLGLSPPAARRFWVMLAHIHGRVLNVSELARAFAMGDHAARRTIDLFEHALLVRTVQPWFANVAKRQVKAPKIYIADSGILHSLLGLDGADAVGSHPGVGSSWEGFALAQVAARLGLPRERCWFWGTHGGAELDLYVEVGGRRLGFEFKRTERPTTTKSMHVAMADLQLDRLLVVHAGTLSFPLAPGIDAIALDRIWSDLDAQP